MFSRQTGFKPAPYAYESVWTALRELEGPGTVPEIAVQSRTSKDTVRQYCQSLTAAGIVREIKPVSRGARRYQLLDGADTGPLALRVHERMVFDPNTHRIFPLEATSGE